MKIGGIKKGLKAPFYFGEIICFLLPVERVVLPVLSHQPVLLCFLLEPLFQVPELSLPVRELPLQEPVRFLPERESEPVLLSCRRRRGRGLEPALT
ncbi:MAG TPA: hypothetical protein VGK97_01840 [Spongiibacteraceae bacterium]|jgi:hypothetical protein